MFTEVARESRDHEQVSNVYRAIN